MIIQQLEADVNVAEIDAATVRGIADINSSIIRKDGDVQKLVIDAMVKNDSLTITQAITQLLLNVVQTSVTINGTSNSNVTQNDQVLAYWYAYNYVQDSGYKRLNTN